MIRNPNKVYKEKVKNKYLYILNMVKQRKKKKINIPVYIDTIILWVNW